MEVGIRKCVPNTGQGPQLARMPFCFLRGCQRGRERCAFQVAAGHRKRGAVVVGLDRPGLRADQRCREEHTQLAFSARRKHSSGSKESRRWPGPCENSRYRELEDGSGCYLAPSHAAFKHSPGSRGRESVRYTVYERIRRLGIHSLALAVRRRDEKAIASLLGSNADIHVRDRNGRSPLHLAARSGLRAITTQLLSVGSNSNARDINGKSPLHLAVGSNEPGSTETTRVLLQHGAFPDLCDSVNQFTPLNHLVYSSLASDPWDSEGKIVALLDAGADIDQPDKFGCLPLLNACVIPWDDEPFKILHARRAQITVVDRMGRGLLNYIAAYGDLDRIEYL
ncbi:ankyrin repeat-containing domain protein [Podospora didyma]|uniref:Ankyrin repeat-containing domain protein n=1 Tax=Podospora didyma TaxID=330526 RepID=A0AAE0NC70_9PEZI|nr:ankyrin repeat-containing domain protein [Podospora didyma]